MGLLVGDILRHGAAVTPHAIAATLDDSEVTFLEFDAASNRTARALAARRVEYAQRVATWSDTSLDALPIFGALAKLGAIYAPLNARVGVDEAAAVLEYARSSLLIVDAAHAEAAKAFDVPTLTTVELISHANRQSDADITEPRLDERDAHVIFFTSGSTARPKGVVLSHRANCLRSFPSLAPDTDGGTVCMFPLFHMAGWSLALGAWQARRPIHFVPTPDAQTLLHTCEQRRASRLYAIPAVWARILEHGVERFDLSALREADTGTSATPPELLSAIRAALPHTFTRVFYGSTEAGAGTVLSDRDLARKPGSVGLPQPGVSVRLAEDGEVCIRSELLMDGYFDDPDASADALRDGWYHTGDLGGFDDEGYLSIVGRVRDVIRTGGETVAPTEVEAVLRTHPGVSEVAVVGLPDSTWGEVICAAVVPAPGSIPPTVDALRAHCVDRLAPFKHPRRLVIVDALPRTTATDQVQRPLLAERLGLH